MGTLVRFLLSTLDHGTLLPGALLALPPVRECLGGPLGTLTVLFCEGPQSCRLAHVFVLWVWT